MKKILSLIVLALVILTACAKTENTEQTSSKDIINQSSHLSSHESSQANQEKSEFKEFNGKIAMLTEDVNLKQPYVITTNADGDTVRLDMDEDVDCSLKKNDIVVVIDEKDEICRVTKVSGDIPRTRGSVEKSKLNFEPSSFVDNANQAVVHEAIGYDAVNGKEQGAISASCDIEERKDAWVRVSMVGGVPDLWFKKKDLSYDFDTVVTDYVR
jgi:hypothetical protein